MVGTAFKKCSVYSYKVLKPTQISRCEVCDSKLISKKE